MIAADTSSLVAYFGGDAGADVEAIATAIADGTLCVPGVVVTEMLSYPKAGPKVAATVAGFALLDPKVGFWERAGEARRAVLAHGFKARIADALIAQSCIDHNVSLVTRDTDFRHFVKHCGLVLA
jgi:predicted nucleic acid-binding protein